MTTVHVFGKGPTDWFGTIEPQDRDSATGKKLPFKLRVAIPASNITPRNPVFDWVLDIGRLLFEPVLRHEPLDTKSITWYLPERWLSVHEQHMLIWQLLHHPEAKKLKTVDILTQNPLITGSVPCSVYVVSLDEGDGVTQEQAYKSKDK